MLQLQLHMLALTLPKKLNPIIRSLMDSVKSEEHKQLQFRSASSICKLVTLFVDVGKISASDKITKTYVLFFVLILPRFLSFIPTSSF